MKEEYCWALTEVHAAASQLPVCWYSDFNWTLFYINVELTISTVSVYTRVVPKVMSNFYLHANWEQQTKESAVVDGTSCSVILECLVTSVACIT